MKKIYNFLICLILIGTGISANGQQLVQASIQKTGPFTITVFARPTQLIPAGSNLNITYALSLPLADAPGPGQVTSVSSIGGLPNAAVLEDFNNRRHYPFNLEVSSSTVPLPANVSTPIATVTFPNTTTGKQVQMNDCGDHLSFTCSNFVYWYFALFGSEVTNLADMFYGTSFSNEYPAASVVTELAPLPIRLLSFNAEKTGEKNAHLSWTTSSEINSNFFSIERSFDKVKWSEIGKVNASGNSQIVTNYQYMDVGVYNGVASQLTVYYRLRMVDIDGTFEYSPIESVNFGKSQSIANSREFLVYPNPASEGVNIQWDANQVDQPTSLEFYDLSGKLVLVEQVADQTNQHYVDFTKSTMGTGLYLLRIMNGTEAIEHKQIVVGQH